MSKLDPLFSSELAQAESRRVRRRLRAAGAAPAGSLALDGAALLNFSSNDYLGLSKHPLLIERSREWAARHGAGAQASRLVCGNLDLHEQVEAKLARLKGTEAALLLASGWQANAAVLPALLRAAAGQGEVQVYACLLYTSLEEQRHDLHQPGEGHHQDAGDDHPADVLLERLVGKKALLLVGHDVLVKRWPARARRQPARGWRGDRPAGWRG